MNNAAGHDEYGEAILAELALARRFSRWMYETIEPFLGDRILEIGSGIGNISRQLPVRQRLALSDYAPAYRARLESAFAGRDRVEVIDVDLTCDGPFEVIGEQFDSAADPGK